MDDKMNGRNLTEKELEQVAGGSVSNENEQCPKGLNWMDADMCRGCTHCCLGKGDYYRCENGAKGILDLW